MFVLNLFSIVLLGNVADYVMPYNPLLTYSMRIRKSTMEPNITGNYTFFYFREKQFVNAHVIIDTKEIINRCVAVFSRCNPEGFDCEYFQTWTLEDICHKVKEENQVWSSWYKAFHPPLVCPIDKKNYRIVNGSVDIGPVVHLYPDMTNYYWKVKQKFYADDTFVGSYTLEVSVFGYRKKIKNMLRN